MPSFCPLKRKMLIGQTLLLAVMSLLTSGLNDQSLVCYSDYISILTCEWNTSALEDGTHIARNSSCSLQGICDNYRTKETVQMDLVPFKPSQPEMLKATLQFKNECLRRGYIHLPVDVLCGNGHVAGISEFDPSSNVKLHPPGQLQVDGANVSWVRGSPHSTRVTSLKYEIQFKRLEESWEGVEPRGVQDTSCLLSEDQLVIGQQYEVRVRSYPKHGKYWSDWSRTTQWTSTVGKPPDQVHKDAWPWFFPSVTTTAAVVVVIIIILLCYFHSNCFQHFNCSQFKSPDMHDPFADLYDKYGGDFRTWLGPIVSVETFVKANMECISPLELYKEQDCNVKDERSFSNSLYFLSQSSKCTMDLEPCAEETPYGPAGGSVEEKVLMVDAGHNSDTENEGSISSPVEMSSSYKHLQKLRLEVQSPDSGFAAGSDQDTQDDSSSEGLPSPPVMSNCLFSKEILACPTAQGLHLAPFPNQQFLTSPGFGWSPQNIHPLGLLQSSITTHTLMDNPDIMAFSGMIEPASDDYMPVKKVQE